MSWSDFARRWSGSARAASDGIQRLDALTESLKRVEVSAQGAAVESEAAQAGAERVESHLLGFTKRIANPQSRGAFGEEALRNQLELVGLRENRDFRRQVKVTGSMRRIDYAVTLRGVTIGLDPKFALDPDLGGISTALAESDETRLAGYARKLVARAKELAAKEYWLLSRFCEHSPAWQADRRCRPVVQRRRRDVESRGGLGRIARRPMSFARRMFSLPDEAEIPETRADCDRFAQDYERLADNVHHEAA